MSDFKINHKLEEAVRIIQKFFRKQLAKKRLKEARRTPGLMSATGTVKMCGLWLVYIMRATNDLETVKVTLKERSLMATIIDKKIVSEEVHQLAQE